MVEAYQNSLEHIIDELKLLDIELGYAISKFIDNNGRQEWNEYSGLYISEKEIKNAFKKDTTEDGTPDNSSTFSKDAAA